MSLLSRYRATGADLPYGDPLRAHGVDMEGYFWRITDVARQRVLIALIGVNRAGDGCWATLGLAGSNGFLAEDAFATSWADPAGLGARAGEAFLADRNSVRVSLGSGGLDLTVTDHVPWPRARFGGSSWFQSVPALNQYWHPWLLGGRASGTAVLGEETWEFTDAQVYCEKNWGREGFPDSWWWGQAQGFEEPGVCVAFAGGQVTAGPLETEVTALVVRLPDGSVVRLGNPVTSPVHAAVTDETWTLRGRNRTWQIELDAFAPLADAHILPVPLPRERRNVPGALEHLAGTMQVRVRRHGRLVWQGSTDLAGLEHGGLDRAARERVRRLS